MDARRRAERHGARRHVAVDEAMRADNRPVADGDAGHNRHLPADPYIGADGDRARDKAAAEKWTLWIKPVIAIANTANQDRG